MSTAAVASPPLSATDETTHSSSKGAEKNAWIGRKVSCWQSIKSFLSDYGSALLMLINGLFLFTMAVCALAGVTSTFLIGNFISLSPLGATFVNIGMVGGGGVLTVWGSTKFAGKTTQPLQDDDFEPDLPKRPMKRPPPGLARGSTSGISIEEEEDSKAPTHDRTAPGAIDAGGGATTVPIGRSSGSHASRSGASDSQGHYNIRPSGKRSKDASTFGDDENGTDQLLTVLTPKQPVIQPLEFYNREEPKATQLPPLRSEHHDVGGYRGAKKRMYGSLAPNIEERITDLPTEVAAEMSLEEIRQLYNAYARRAPELDMVKREELKIRQIQLAELIKQKQEERREMLKKAGIAPKVERKRAASASSIP